MRNPELATPKKGYIQSLPTTSQIDNYRIIWVHGHLDATDVASDDQNHDDDPRRCLAG
jgi:hypothetical protein